MDALCLQCSACDTHVVAAVDRCPLHCSECGAALHEGPPCDAHLADVLEATRRAFGISSLNLEGRRLEGDARGVVVRDRNGAAELSRLGYFAFIRNGTLQLIPHRATARPDNDWRVPIGLFVAAIVTTLLAGWNFVAPQVEAHAVSMGRGVMQACEFSFSVLFILMCHEFGHWFAARFNAIRATPPYVLPVPLLFGTMGAFIQMRSPPPDRDAMVKLGAAGPLAGMIATIVVLLFALPFSSVVAASGLRGDYLSFGEPLLMKALSHWLGPTVPPGAELVEHPAVLAGWFGLLVTALNLLPCGQLDGGHVLRAFISDTAQRRFTRALALLLLPLGWFCWPGWYLWAAVALFFSFLGNPGATDESAPLSPTARWMAALCLVSLILSFCPAPIAEMTFP